MSSLTAEEVRAYGERLDVTANWGRWGVDDQRGTLNLVTEEAVQRAGAEVRTGQVISLGHPLDPNAPPYYPAGLNAAAEHEMLTAWRSNAGGPVQAASDQLHVQCHGLDTTHMDALCHIGYGGIGWNGQDFQTMVDMGGAQRCDMLTAGPVVTRGVLVDVPRLRGVDHLDPSNPIRVEDIERACPQVEPGDALIIRGGRARAVAGHTSAAAAEGRTRENPYGLISGLHHNVMGMVGRFDCGLLGTDGPADNFPHVDDNVLPIHVLSLVHLGLHLLHNLALEELADALAAADRTSFLLTAAPLPLPRGTGSPIAPIAVL